MSWKSYALAVLALAVFSAQFYWSFSATTFTYGSYLHMRQAQSILGTGLPIRADPLGFGGRQLLVLPFFDYVLAIVSALAGKALAFRIVPAALAALTVVCLYLCARELSHNDEAALFAAALAGFSPFFSAAFFRALSSAFLALPLFLLVLYSFMRLDSSRAFIASAIVFFVLLLFTDPLYAVLVLALLLYMLFLRMENIRHAAREVELAAFLVFLAIWASLLVYKDALLMHGVAVFVGNVPAALQQQRVGVLSVLGVVFSLGVAPFILGLYSLYLYVFQRKNKAVYLVVSCLIVVFFVIAVLAGNTVSSLLLALLLLAMLSALAYAHFFTFLEKTNFARFGGLLRLLVAVLVIGIVLVPSLVAMASAPRSLPQQADVAALEWLGANAPNGSVVMGRAQEGFMIEQLAHAKTVLDDSFMLAPDAADRYADTQRVYVTYETDALRLLRKYNVDYLFFSNETQSAVGTPLYLSDTTCFKRVYSDGAAIYAPVCEVSSGE